LKRVRTEGLYSRQSNAFFPKPDKSTSLLQYSNAQFSPNKTDEDIFAHADSIKQPKMEKCWQNVCKNKKKGKKRGDV